MCSKRKSLPHLVPLITGMAFQPVAPKVFKMQWPHSFLLLRTILGPGLAETPSVERNKKSWFWQQCTRLCKQVGFFFRSIKFVFNKIAPDMRGLGKGVIDDMLVTPGARLSWLNLIKNHFQIWRSKEPHDLPPSPSACYPPYPPLLQSYWRCFASDSVFNWKKSCAWHGLGHHH